MGEHYEARTLCMRVCGKSGICRLYFCDFVAAVIRAGLGEMVVLSRCIVVSQLGME